MRILPDSCSGTSVAGGADVDLDVAAQHVGDGLHAALVGHVHDVDVGRHLQHLADELRLRALAEAEVELAGIGPGVGHQLLHGSSPAGCRRRR